MSLLRIGSPVVVRADVPSFGNWHGHIAAFETGSEPYTIRVRFIADSRGDCSKDAKFAPEELILEKA